MSYAPYGLSAPVGASTGTVVAYTEFAANVSVPATTEAGATTIVTAPSFVSDGTPVWIEFFSYQCVPATSDKISFVIYQESTSGGFMGNLSVGTAVANPPVYLKIKRTPPSGVRTYSVRGFVTSVSGTVGAGAGTGTGVAVPGFLLITKA